MLVVKDFKDLLKHLLAQDVVHLNISEFDISLYALEDATKILFSTQVYDGGNFIPKSVRTSANQSASFTKNHISAFLRIDETKYQISLNYIGAVDFNNNSQLKFILDDFHWLANKWKLHLEEHGRNDLVHIKAK